MSIDNEMINLQNSTATLQSNVNAKKPVLDTAASNADTAKAQATAKAAEATDSVESIKSNARSAKLKAEQAEASAIAAEQVSQGIATALPKVKPTLNLDFVNNKTFDSRIDFTRSTTATYYDGKTVAKAEENLHRSVELISVNNMSRTLNATVAPDGTTTAVKFVPTSGADRHSFVDYAVFPKTTYWFSIYLKAAEHSLFRMSDGNSGSFQVGFDLSSGEIIYTNGSSYLDSSITDAGNGWYRCAVKLFRATGVRVFNSSYPSSGVTLDNYSPIFFGDDVSGVYAWGAQVEERDFLTAYTPTTGSPITNYIPVLKTAEINEPRIDHDPVSGKCKGFLMEGSRTNYVRRSQDFNIYGIDWDYSSNVITKNNITIAPDGTKMAGKVIPTGGHRLAGHMGLYASMVEGATYTMSGFYKHDGSYWTRVRLGGYFGGENAVFDFTTGEFESETMQANVVRTSAVDVGNGWWRLAVTYVFQNGIGNLYPYACAAQLLTAEGSTTPPDSAEYNGVYIWGMQYEKADFPSSYIPTSGATVTRGVESSSISGNNLNDVFNNSEFSLYAEMQRTGSSSTHQEFAGIELSDSTFQKGVLSLAYDAGSFNRPNARLFNEAGSMTVITGVSGSTPNFEYGESVAHFALGVKQGSSLLAFNGTLGNNNPSTTTTPFTPEHLRIQPDNIRDTFSDFYGYCRKVSLYDRRLPDSELQALTQE